MMGNSQRIPLIKSRIVTTKPKKSSNRFPVTVIVLSFALMISYVWLKVQTNLLLSTIQDFEIELKQNQTENEKLQAEIIKYSRFGRINKIAQEELGLVFLPNENFIEISPE